MAGENTILVIDDNDAVRRAFTQILREGGYDVFQAEDGPTGLEVWTDLAPDLVLCDLRMPGMDGLEVLSRMAQEAPDTPFIVVSGAGTVGDAVEALRRGAWDYVTKPVDDPELLLQAVRRALDKARLVRENREYRSHLEALNRQLSETLGELQADQEAGRAVQFQLLPQDGLSLGGYVFERRLFPSQVLSGDFVDYFALGDRHVGLYLVDVSGHGAASAFVTAMLAALVGQYREALARAEDDTILHPERMLTTLNRDLRAQKLNKHATMFYAVVDLQTDTMVYANAGHFPFPLVHYGADKTQALEAPGRPLGLFDEATYAARELPLTGLRSMLLASDGVLELRGPDGHAGRIERLSALLRTTGSGTGTAGAAGGIDGLVGQLGLIASSGAPSSQSSATLPHLASADGPLRDDVTLLLVRKEAGT